MLKKVLNLSAGNVRIIFTEMDMERKEVFTYGCAENNSAPYMLIPCLYVDENLKYIDIDMLNKNLLAGLNSPMVKDVLTFSIVQDWNASIEAMIQLFLIANSIGDKVIEFVLNPIQNRNFNKIKNSIIKLKSLDRKALSSMMYQGLLDNTIEKVFEKAAPIKEIYRGNKLVIIDTHNIYHRYFHAMDEQLNESGENISLVTAFINFLPSVIQTHNPDFILFTNEGKNLIRKALSTGYKSLRPGIDEDLRKSISHCNNLLYELGFSVVESLDFEADDVIASYATEFVKYGGDVVIYSTDKDLQQLASNSVSLYNHFERSFIDEVKITKNFGSIRNNDASSFRMRDFLALMGDASDGIKGVPGIGKVTAEKLLIEHTDVAGIIKAIPEMKKSKMKENLESFILELRLSQKLATLHNCLAQDVNFEELRIPQNLIFNPENVKKYLAEKVYL
ncbi:MAG TPA: hypothetical protein EYG89_00610 [Bacteroidia bacterium]|nr:hypothetical protein [Bacteroidia bacterium]